MVEHHAWIGPDYPLGIAGQRIALVGWSHWGDENFDTIDCVNKVMLGDWRIRFFTQIRDYFGFCEHSAFWRRVVFFNFLPSVVGGAAERFGHGTPEQQQLGRRRFLRIIADVQPHKVVVFTSRRWAFPPVEGKEPLGAGQTQFYRGQYLIKDQQVAAFFLRHPQGADGQSMRQAVKRILELPSS